jgi:hypothetical protein
MTALLSAKAMPATRIPSEYAGSASTLLVFAKLLGV